MTLKTLPSREVQNNFGYVADTVKSGEPIVITQYGRPTLMLVNFRDGQEMFKLMNAQKLRSFLGTRTANVGSEAKNLSMTDINKIVHESRI